MLSPSPESVRSIAARCNVALLAAIAGEDEQVVAGSGDAVWVDYISLIFDPC